MYYNVKRMCIKSSSEGEGSSRGDVPNGKLVRILGDGNDKQ